MPTPLFKKGQSGNPRGRPRKTPEADPVIAALKEALKAISKPELVALARSHAPQAVQTLIDCLRDPRHRVAAAQALLDRGYGKPQMEIAGAADRPVAIQFTWAPAQQSEAKTIDSAPAKTIDSAPIEGKALELVWSAADGGE